MKIKTLIMTILVFTFIVSFNPPLFATGATAIINWELPTNEIVDNNCDILGQGIQQPLTLELKWRLVGETKWSNPIIAGIDVTTGVITGLPYDTNIEVEVGARYASQVTPFCFARTTTNTGPIPAPGSCKNVTITISSSNVNILINE